jgi:Rrf2 family protein
MKSSNRLSVALHVLAHLAEQPSATMTSEELASCVRTNPVVIRRTLAGLREAGLVTSTPGPGGGWALARDAASTSIADVTSALGERILFGVDLSLAPGCAIQRSVAHVLDDFLEDAEALLQKRLGGMSVADLGGKVRGRGKTGNRKQEAGNRNGS